MGHKVKFKSPYSIHGGIDEDQQQDYIEHQACPCTQAQLKIGYVHMK